MYYLLYLLCVTLIYYNVKKKFPLIVLHKNEGLVKNKIKLITYNVQRLPYIFLRPKIDIKKLIDKYDIVCLQENFCQLFSQYKSFDVNCVIPDCSVYKLVNSGLTVYSKLPLEYVKFVRFNNLTSVDKLSDKGFLIVKVNGIVIVNTHLQATYNLTNELHFQNSYEQVGMIINEVENYDKVIICGDFNIKLNEFKVNEPYKIACPNVPTHWSNMHSFLSGTSATEKNGMVPFILDGAIYKNLEIDNINVELEDKYTDHLGVSFEIILD